MDLAMYIIFGIIRLVQLFTVYLVYELLLRKKTMRQRYLKVKT